MQAQVEECLGGDVQFVLVGLVARIGHVLHHGPGEACHHRGQVAHPVGLGHLVEDLHPHAALGRVGQRQLDTAGHVLDVDERPRLTAGAVHGERIADRGLHQEAVQHGAVVAVVIEAVHQPLIELRLGGGRAPDDALVQVGDAQRVVLRVVGEQVLVEHLGHVVDRAGAGGIEDLAVHLAGLAVHGDVEISLGDLHAGGAVAVDAHRAQVHQVDVQARFDDGAQHIVGGVDVVVHRVALVAR